MHYKKILFDFFKLNYNGSLKTGLIKIILINMIKAKRLASNNLNYKFYFCLILFQLIDLLFR